MKKILCIDDEPTNLQILRQTLNDHYQLMFATSGFKAIDVATQHLPDLILLDIMMPDMDGYEVCRQLKANPLTAGIPVIFVSAKGEADDETLGFDVGAVDYITKPVSPSILVRRVACQLTQVRVEEMNALSRAAIRMLGEAGHFNDTDTGQHIWRMASYSRLIAEASGWSEQMGERIELAAPMHDMGKIGIPDAILKAPRKLTDQEWDIMKQHAQIGADILLKCDNPIFIMASEIALCHHEKWDGSGYPNRLSGDAIPESARIVAIADVFDALTMKRPYKDPWSLKDSLAEIKRGSGSHFEPRLVDIFEQVLPDIARVKEEWMNKEPALLASNDSNCGCQ